ncbi:MAG: 6-carboxytetrahydropterin synthase, partial [Acidobacteriota bacterium]
MSEPRTAADPSTAEGVFTLVLAKEDFKFSSAHFTLFGAEDAETLHGHNYRVAVELVGRRLDDDEMLASLVEVKRAIRAACARLDERTLIPTASRHLTIEQIDDHVEVAYGARRYRLPTDDVLLLDLGNTSIE